MKIPLNSGKLTIDQKGAILCPVCRRRIRRVRLNPDAVLRGVSVQCSECRTVLQVHIDQACATWTARAID